jgi:cytochrome c553
MGGENWEPGCPAIFSEESTRMAVSPRRVVAIACILLVPASAAASGQPAAARLEFFEKKVRPVLVGNCYNCHSANTNAHGGLRVDDRNGLLQGGRRGPAVVPGQPDKSLLLQAVRHTHPQVKMPPKKHLSEEQIADLAQWIKDGAAWPGVHVPTSIASPSARYDRLRREHWAWQPLRPAPVPAVKNAAWPQSDVDRLVLAGLEARGLTPVRDADRTALLRRVRFDLTGLPPTPEDIEAFVSDTSPDALARVVDRLLASPAFGERFGRHWLDVARYGESTGSARNVPYPHAWRYRDYVIQAFNRDKPYDQFVREQIAGDLLPARSPEERDEHAIATGFLALGVRDVNQRFKVRFVMDNIDEQIDTVSRSVLALTVSCARCHNHKFDPIPTTDYYALAGIFHSTDLCAGVRNKMGGGGLDYYDTARLLPLGAGERPRPGPGTDEKIAAAKKALAVARAEFQAIAGTPAGKERGPDGRPKQMIARQKVNRLEEQLLALSDPAAQGPVALGVRDARTVGDTAIRIRGEAEQIGPVVPRGFLSTLPVPDVPPINPKQSGRLELALWLTSPHNPLTPRVLVNRVWQHLFGQGLVKSVDNFGVTGDKPSHPELLDYLAQQFVRDGWSIKRLVRMLVLSRAYQLGAESTPAHLAIDPGNALLWRRSPRRLDAEEIRDAMLAAAGRLTAGPPATSLAKELKVMELPNNGPLARRLEEEAFQSIHRSVYLPLLRTLTPRALEVFDFADQGLVTGSRDTTTVAPQALYLLNDPFVLHQAQALSRRLEQPDMDDAGRILLAYRLTMGRPATTQEIERARRYLEDYEAASRAEGARTPLGPRAAAWASFCQALLASAEFRYIR